MKLQNYPPPPQFTQKLNAGVKNLKIAPAIAFSGTDRFEKSKQSGIGSINHQTAFFREPLTDEYVQNYIRENFADKKEVHIVSGASSTGEEAYSYACMLDDMPNKIKITGFDIDPTSIDQAQAGTFDVKRYIADSKNRLHSENFLLEDDTTDDYHSKCKAKFYEHFMPTCAKERIEEDSAEAVALDAFTPQSIDKSIEAMKKHNPFGFSEDDIKKLLAELKDIFTAQKEDNPKDIFEVQRFKFGKDSVKNCDINFQQGDVMNLTEQFEENSVDVLLYRNALYHTLCYGNSMARQMKPDSKETMEKIAGQMHKILSDNGLLVFGEHESRQGIDKKQMYEIMINAGFEPVILEDESQEPEWYRANIWKKVKK